MQKRWKILKADETKIAALQDALKINKTLCKLLIQRGVNTYEEAKFFFRPSLEDLHSPWLMKDMQKAVNRIVSAIEQKESILVYGDYDVDGTTAVASMYQFLSSLHEPIDFYIPHRYKEGYGISKAGIDFAHEAGYTLIISLDCGIKSADLIGYAQTLGIDFVVCDHHLPDKILPPAVAILNPKQIDCPYPFKELCGCGVGFKLMMALSEHFKLPDERYLKYIDLAAVAIAADIVPVIGENRILAFHGVEKVNKNPSTGIKALLELAGIKKKMSLNSLVFVVAPRINAAGRMDDARKAVLLFVEQDEAKAMEYANMLHSDNTNRREADSTITEEALAILEMAPDNHLKSATVIYQEHWHKGVVGIVASRLIDTYYRPTIVLTKSGDYAAGSARSVHGFNLYEAVHACKEHLLGYGGHFAAAGMTLDIANIEAFAAAFEKEVCARITEDQLVPEIIIDSTIQFNEINPTFYKILCQMEPFGPDNMRPVFIAHNVMDTGFSKIVKEQHLKFSVKQNNISFNGIGFNMADKFPLLQSKQNIDLLFTIDENDFQGNVSLQLKVIDVRISSDAMLAS
jgi:single-stranded-DNA-specific exonuclease